MSDIVERLAVLEQFGFSQLGKDIKAEIERLQAINAEHVKAQMKQGAEIERLRGQYMGADIDRQRLRVYKINFESVARDNERMEAEIEQLQATRQLLSDITKQMIINEQKAEIEWLREDNEHYQADREKAEAEIERLQELVSRGIFEIGRLQAENERLEEALKVCRELKDGYRADLLKLRQSLDDSHRT